MAITKAFKALFTTAEKALLPQFKTLFKPDIKGIFANWSIPNIFQQQQQALKAIMTPKQIIKKLGTTPQLLMKEIVFEPWKVSQRLGKLTTAERKELAEGINDAIGVGTTDASPLSSSWLTYGEFEMLGGGAGFLTLTTKQGRSYIYPNVSLATWIAMKSAGGSNGSGAGSVFWNQYLRGAKTTTGYQFFQQAVKASAGRIG